MLKNLNSASSVSLRFIKKKLEKQIVNQLQKTKNQNPTKGFTLTELMVGLTISLTIISTLLTFMLNVIETDRKEQAKATSEQEIQTALEYIFRDLQQAVYIYDANGIDAIKNQLPATPNGTDRVPVLVFWQKELLTDVIPTSGRNKDDAFVYSLVIYYLIKDTINTDSTWSKAARIGRWKIRDGVPANIDNENITISCSGYTQKYFKGSSSDPDEFCPSSGFAPFDLNSQGTIEEIMNNWKKGSQPYTTNTNILVDYIDQTTNNPPPEICPPNSTNPKINWSKVPPDSFNNTQTGQMTSFYGCVDRLNTTAQVFIRGNAQARLNNNAVNNYHPDQITYFPSSSIKVQGRGLLYK